MHHTTVHTYEIIPGHPGVSLISSPHWAMPLHSTWSPTVALNHTPQESGHSVPLFGHFTFSIYLRREWASLVSSSPPLTLKASYATVPD